MKTFRRYRSGRFAGRALLALGLGALTTSVAKPQKVKLKNESSEENTSSQSVPVRSKTPQGTPNLQTPASAASQRDVAKPAIVNIQSGTLTIKATNSDLSQILRDVSRDSGMVVEGPVRDVRVYGNYGPKAPQDVLTQLLSGLGYNIVMEGSAREGAPGRLILTTRGDGPSSPMFGQPQSGPIPSVARQPEEPVLGPGAIPHPPPELPDDPQARVKRNLERLQKMHETQTNENVPR